MNGTEFLRLMGEIDGGLIVNAKDVPAPHRSPAWRRMLIIAAAACLVVGALTAMIVITMRESPDAPPIDTETNETTDVPGTADTQVEEYFDHFSTLLIGGDFESSCGVSGNGEIVLGATTTHDTQAPREYVMERNGEHVVFSYVETCTEFLYQEKYHVYENREKRLKIRVNVYTEQVTFFTSYAPNPINPEHPVYTEQELYDVAYAFLCQRVSDPEAYQVTDRELFDGEEDGLSDELKVEFSRMVNGIATSDSIVLYVSNGQIGLYKMQNFGQMRNVTPLTTEQMSLIEEVVSSRVEKVYRDVDPKYSFSHKDTTYKLMRMSDGRMAIRCYPLIEVTNVDTGTTYEDALDMLIYLN